ncbi:hypothetical protein [Shewanella inventionis]|uniref:Uncharacterized protein n=1 Tax=Shewanella inventionis TaxID=1738770 RepID=A0ABQ1JPE1_9GAMM|nr:hypothetical protein [Shewanella inventionis]MCL1159510.1 hypothetical protein [Shewanella inventionis]GGB73453.1 hypothetical protein GCM10011607_37390 [Shewanella inventionis]
MYHEVALDPRCMAEYHYYGLLKERFGFETGRYVVAPVKEWAKQAFQAAKHSDTLKPVKRKSITNFLNNLQRSKDQPYFILPLDRISIFADDWSDWCTRQTAILPFNSIVSEQFAGAIKYDDLIDGHDSWLMPPSRLVNKEAKDISASLSTLIRFGGNVFIVDQYFRLANNPVLKSIFKLIQEFHSISSMTLVTSINTADPQKVFQQEFIDVYDHIPTFSLIVAPERYFHDRYVITDKGAIKSGHGFSEGVEQGVQADKLSLSLCSVEEASITKKWIQKAITEQKAKRIVLFE